MESNKDLSVRLLSNSGFPKCELDIKAKIIPINELRGSEYFLGEYDKRGKLTSVGEINVTDLEEIALERKKHLYII